MRRDLPILVALGALLVGSSCGGSGSAASARPQRQALRVRVTPVLVQDVVHQIKALGSLEAEDMLQVTAQVEGVASDVRFREGDRVSPASVLLRIDPDGHRGEAVRPVIHALTDEEHPCQILADLFTIREKRGALEACKIVFIGDGACNVAYSWIFAAAKTGIDLWIAAPKQFQPDPSILRRAGGNVRVTDNLAEAARGADAFYTDVWVSMGKEEESADRLKVLAPYQIDDTLVAQPKPGALVMHCLPAYREKEITGSVFAAHQQTIFDQAENRLHAEKALVTRLAEVRD